MRTLIPLLLLACLAYAGWHYWQRYTDTPLRERLLLATPETTQRVVIGDRAGAPAFHLRRAADTNRWIVSRDHRELLDQDERARAFVTALTELRSDSLGRGFVTAERSHAVVVHSSTHGAETIELGLPPAGPGLVRLTATGDVFSVPRPRVEALLPYLRFGHYRDRRLLDLAADRVDSIIVSHHDSLLRRHLPSDSLSRLAQALIAPASAPFADYFDEIGDRDHYHATATLYAEGAARRVTVFRDSLWPRPLVLVGEDYPRRYLAADTLR